MSFLGLDLGGGRHPGLGGAGSERPKEGDVRVSPLMPKSPLPLKPRIFRSADRRFSPGHRIPQAIPLAGTRASTRSCWSISTRSTLVGSTQERAAEGVVAYSAICPHAGCEVNGWLADQQILECSCHYSHYNPREAAAVMDGPATRSLAALPLKIVEGKLTVAKPFTGRVGIVPT